MMTRFFALSFSHFAFFFFFFFFFFFCHVMFSCFLF